MGKKKFYDTNAVLKLQSKIFEDELKEYENFVKKSEKILKKNKIEPKEKGLMADLMSKMGMNIEMMKDKQYGFFSD